MTGSHLAQVNVARLAAPLESPQLADFVANLEPVNALRDYVYRSAHADVLRRRQEWFEQMAEAHVALWWLEAGTLPTLGDARERLMTLRAEGPTQQAFTLREPYPARPQAPAT